MGNTPLPARAAPGRGTRAWPPLPHLAGGRDWALDIHLSIELNGEVVSRGNALTLYWTMPHMLGHATSNGATLRTGDLMATGTISGPNCGSEESLLELYSDERFLADGDEVILRGRAAEIDLGEVRGAVVRADVKDDSNLLQAP